MLVTNQTATNLQCAVLAQGEKCVHVCSSLWANYPVEMHLQPMAILQKCVISDNAAEVKQGGGLHTMLCARNLNLSRPHLKRSKSWIRCDFKSQHT